METTKLSTLIREGSKGMVYTSNQYYLFDGDQKVCGVCAIGAARVAVGFTYTPGDPTYDDSNNEMTRRIGYAIDTPESVSLIPEDALIEMYDRAQVSQLRRNHLHTLHNIIAELNDYGKFGDDVSDPRPIIADWLESIGL